jgi:hypothetical protein
MNTVNEETKRRHSRCKDTPAVWGEKCRTSVGTSVSRRFVTSAQMLTQTITGDHRMQSSWQSTFLWINDWGNQWQASRDVVVLSDSTLVHTAPVAATSALHHVSNEATRCYGNSWTGLTAHYNGSFPPWLWLLQGSSTCAILLEAFTL